MRIPILDEKEILLTEHKKIIIFLKKRKTNSMVNKFTRAFYGWSTT